MDVHILVVTLVVTPDAATTTDRYCLDGR